MLNIQLRCCATSLFQPDLNKYLAADILIHITQRKLIGDPDSNVARTTPRSVTFLSVSGESILFYLLTLAREHFVMCLSMRLIHTLHVYLYYLKKENI